MTAWFVGCCALLSLTVIRLPVYFGGQAVIRGGVVVVLLFCILWALDHVRRNARVGHGAWLAGAFAVLVGIALVRASQLGVIARTSAMADALTYVLVVAFGVTLMLSSASKAQRDERLTYVALAPAVYAIVNLLMYAGGLRAPDTDSGSAGYSAELLGYIGLNIGRVQFPLATSVNLYAVTMAAGLVGCVLLFLRVPSAPRWLTVIGGVACFTSILMTDSRVALAVVIGVVVYHLLAARRFGSGWVAVVIPLLPLLLIGAIAIGDSAGASQTLSTNGREFDTASGRLDVWRPAWDFIASHPGGAILGWGGYGHYASGASVAWLSQFKYFLDEPLITAQTHNLVLQTIFDIGWVGLGLLVAAAWSALRSLDRRGRAEPEAPFLVLNAMLLALLFCGISEVAPTYFSQEALLTMLMIMGVAGVYWVAPSSSTE